MAGELAAGAPAAADGPTFRVRATGHAAAAPGDAAAGRASADAAAGAAAGDAAIGYAWRAAAKAVVTPAQPQSQRPSIAAMHACLFLVRWPLGGVATASAHKCVDDDQRTIGNMFN